MMEKYFSFPERITHGVDAEGIGLSVVVDVLHKSLSPNLVLTIVCEGKLHLV